MTSVPPPSGHSPATPPSDAADATQPDLQVIPDPRGSAPAAPPGRNKRSGGRGMGWIALVVALVALAFSAVALLRPAREVITVLPGPGTTSTSTTPATS